MSSPIHNYLFSPPPSPPSLPANVRLRSPALASMASFLLPASETEDLYRSPKTPTQKDYTMENPVYPTIEITDMSETTPRPPSRASFAMAYESVPVHSPARTAFGITVPKPLIRLMILAGMFLSFVWLASERNMFSYKHTHGVNPILENTHNNYVPPQMYAKRFSPANDGKAAAAGSKLVARQPVPPPRTTRPMARPLPASHELLALQSYLLQSRYNILPADTDTSEPLDANLVLGGDADEAALGELEKEHANEIIVWYGGDDQSIPPHELLNALAAIHGSNKRPTLLPLHGRPDLQRLLRIGSRFDVDLSHPLIMLGNRPISADPETWQELHNSGKLRNLMASIGWKDEGDNTPRKKFKPKVAKIARRSLTEVEAAIKLANAR